MLNSLVFLLSYSVSYFVAPVFYVGMLHAAIVHSFGFSDAIANLPEAVFTSMLVLPMLIAWVWPSSRYLKPILFSSFLLKGLAGMAVVVPLVLGLKGWLVAALVLHAAIIGGMNGVSNMCLWELIGRGTAASTRGFALGLAFGLGPIFAVLGSCISQLVLSGNFLDVIHTHSIAKPWNYALLFGATGPAMAVAAACVFLARVPKETAAEPKASLIGVGRGLREYLTHPWIMIAAVGFVLTAAGGNTILPNVGMYVRDALHEPPEKYTGLQMAIRFGFKSLFGFGLGFLLAKSHPKFPALLTTVICFAGLLWALCVPGKWYLLSFAMLGAGELFYVYYLNYITGCSAPARIRENIAYTNCIYVIASPAAVVYGSISDHFTLKSSFLLAGEILIVAMLVVGIFLPRKPALMLPRRSVSA